MILGLYVHRRSPVHRIPAAVKVLTLFAAGIGVFLVPDPLWLLPALAAGLSIAVILTLIESVAASLTAVAAGAMVMALPAFLPVHHAGLMPAPVSAAVSFTEKATE